MDDIFGKTAKIGSFIFAYLVKIVLILAKKRISATENAENKGTAEF